MRRALFASLVALASLLGAGSALADPWRGGHGGYSHGRAYGPGYGHGGYGHGYSGGYYHGGHRGPRVFVGPVPYAPYAWWGAPVLGWWGWPVVSPVVVQSQTVVREEPIYVERGPAAAPEGYWYYCQSAGAYYPDVPSCAEPWVPVPPRPE